MIEWHRLYVVTWEKSERGTAGIHVLELESDPMAVETNAHRIHG
jgi:hypothetical protein